MSFDQEYELDLDDELGDDQSNLLTDIDKIDRADSASQRAKKAPVIRIDYDLCENSGCCVQVCPEDVIETRAGQSVIVQPVKCTECWICVENCAAGAVEIG
jgi:ferredoxin